MISMRPTFFIKIFHVEPPPDLFASILSPDCPLNPRLQNSSYFCVFKYARAVKQKAWSKAENRERDWGETHTPYGRARLARGRLLRHALPISLLILRKKPDYFAVYLNPEIGTEVLRLINYSREQQPINEAYLGHMYGFNAPAPFFSSR